MEQTAQTLAIAQFLEKSHSDEQVSDICIWSRGDISVRRLGEWERGPTGEVLFGEGWWPSFLQTINAPSEIKHSWEGRLSVGHARFRACGCSHFYGTEMILRRLPSSIPSPNEIMLPEALIQQFLKFKYGMFLFFGQTGAGKSTSLASLLQERARQRHERIITLEDPVEFIIDDKLPTLVVQRMKNEHFDSFQEAIHICLRQAPDIVLVGEIRDSKTAEIALGLAENGHIVVATIHAPVAAHAIARYIEMVGPDMSAHARSTLASVPLLIAGQRLLRHPDEPKRVPIHEVLWSTDAIAHHIRENNLHMINQAMQTGRKLGMQSFDHSIIERIEQEMLPRNMMPRNQLATS